VIVGFRSMPFASRIGLRHQQTWFARPDDGDQPRPRACSLAALRRKRIAKTTVTAPR